MKREPPQDMAPKTQDQASLRPNKPRRRTPPAEGEIAHFKAADGLVLRYAHWPRDADPEMPAVIFQTGRTEFIEKYYEAVHDLRDRGFQVLMMDWRGQGGSGRTLDDPLKGHVRDYADYLDDANRFLDEIVARKSEGPRIALSHSMGGHITLRLIKERPGVFERAVLSAPMVDIDLARRAPLVRHIVVPLMSRLARGSFAWGTGGYDPATAPFDGNDLTSDPDRFHDTRHFLGRDPTLGIGGPTWGWLQASLCSIAILNAPGYPEGIRTPVLLAVAGEDRVVSQAAIRRIAARLPGSELVEIAGARHEILKERDEFQAMFWDAFDSFVAR